ncbi:hypothetical protein HKD37_01G000399 [Glycine soja]
MLLKDSLNEPNLLSEAYPLCEEVSSLSEYKTLMLSQRTARLARNQPVQRGFCLFSCLARPCLLSTQPLTLTQRDMLTKCAFVSSKAQKSLKTERGGEMKRQAAWKGRNSASYQD